MKQIIRTILYDWQDKKLPQVFAREISLTDYVKLKPRKIIAITGFRRTGKTYLGYKLISRLLKARDKEQVVYINFEDERIPAQTGFLTELLPTVKQTFGESPQVLFLDEIQNIPNWSKWLRRIYDNEDFLIFVTGSSSKMSSQEIPTELRGRCLEVNVFPLSFKEFLKFKNINLDLKNIEYSENRKVKLLKALEEYLYYGALPEVVLSDENKKFEIIQQYYQAVIQRDIIERFKVKNQEALRAVLRLLLNSTYYSVNKLYNNLKSLNYKTGKTSLLNYISYTENSYFLYSLPIFSYKIKDQMQYPRKAYFIDNGFINALSTKFSKNSGRLYENLCFIELKRRSKADTEIFYWKDQAGKEVDFVIKQGLRISQLIQVCYSLEDADTRKRETKALLKASRELKCDDLLIITEDYEADLPAGGEKNKNKRIKFMPLWKWLLS